MGGILIKQATFMTIRSPFVYNRLAAAYALALKLLRHLRGTSQLPIQTTNIFHCFLICDCAPQTLKKVPPLAPILTRKNLKKHCGYYLYLRQS